ncbi:MAG: 50S ribosomal protein L23 [bacterium]|nr:50S ribosomal protein L23 [bacterium]
MSFLNLRKNKKVSAQEKTPIVSVPKKLAVSAEKEKKGAPNVFARFIERPRVSEKATLLAGANCYAFEVLRTANKHQIAQAVQALYKVVPREVRMLAIPKKALFVRGKKGSTGGGKKAYVFLEKGDKIEL